MDVECDIMTFTYVIDKQKRKPIIILFCRDKNLNRLRVAIRGFKPFFYIPDENGDVVDVFGRRVRKIYVDIPTEVREARKAYPWTDMADIPFVVNFLKTKKIKSSIRVRGQEIEPIENLHIPPKILYFDIEVESPPEILPRPEDPQYPIVLISCSSNYFDEIYLFTLADEALNEPSPEAKKFGVTSKPVVLYAKDERELLNMFIDFVETQDFDVLAGWNLVKMTREDRGFDWPYIYRRALRLGINIRRISPIRSIDEINIRGRELFDMLRAYRQYHKPLGELQTYDFKYVVKLETGFEYEDYGDRIHELMQSNKKRLLEYGYNDAIALRLLDERIHLIDFYDKLRRLAGCRLREAIFNSRVIDYIMMDLTDKPLPTRRHFDETPEKVRGAIVVSPKPGLHENVAVFDIKSLYPSIIMAYELDPTPEKIMPKVVRYLQDLRDTYREERRRLEREGKKDSEEYQIVYRYEWLAKFLAASCYGVFAYKGFRLYDQQIANEITRRGRDILQKIISFVGEDNVIYGDTDSIFIKVSDIEHGKTLEEKLNKLLQDIHKAFSIKFEKFYKKVYFKGIEKGVKKRYAGLLVWKEGANVSEIEIKGLEPRRSDASELTRKLMRDFFEKLLTDKRNEAIKMIIDAWQNIRNYPAYMIGIPRGVKRWQAYKVDNPWLRGMEYAERHFKIKFREDRKPLLFYVKAVLGKPKTDVICLTHDFNVIPKEIIVDWGIMREKVIGNKFRPIFKSLGLNFDALMNKDKLTRWIR